MQVSFHSFFSKNIEDIFNIENADQLFDKKLTDFPESFKSIIDSDIYNSLSDFTKRENETILINLYWR
jgi:hypothetical protein